MKSAQIGGSEVLLNTVGYHIDQDPAPILVVQPTLELVDEWSKNRLAPMIRDTPRLRGKVREARARDSDNRIREKKFPGGRVTLAGANSPSSLAGRPMRIVLCDDVDRFPESTGSEGDPILLARKRTTTFTRTRKIVLVSTPTVKDASRIEAAFLKSDQRFRLLPCPDCGRMQRLRWGGPDAAFGVKWPGPRNPAHRQDEEDPARAYYLCAHCGSEWSDAQRRAARHWGRWEATRPFRGVAGFHISELYSGWVSLEEIVEAWLEAKDDPVLLRVFVNTVLGESWEEQSTPSIDENALFGRRESYGGALEVPAQCSVLTGSVDVQDDRLEFYVEGWARDEESFGTELYIVRGDPSTTELWDKLDKLILFPRKHASGLELPISAVAVDTGGHHTQSAYRFCRDRGTRRVWAIKGKHGPHPVWPVRPSRRNLGKVDLFSIGVDGARDAVHKRLRIGARSGPGVCHFNAAFDLEWFRQLTARRPVTKFRGGHVRREWKKIRPRDEAFALKVYSFAALQGLIAGGLDLNAECNALEEKLGTVPTPPLFPEPPPRPTRRRMGWIKRRSHYWGTR